MFDVAGLARAGTSAASLEDARLLRGEVPKRTVIPIRRSFVRRDDSGQAEPPLARLLHGDNRPGRGGKVAIKLYVALIWKSVKAPYDTAIPAARWASLLDLPDPRGKGQRTIARAIDKLVEAQLIHVKRRPGRPPELTLLDEGGDGTPYVPAGDAYSAAERKNDDVAKNRNRYFRVPTELWTSGLFQELEGPGLVVLLALLAEEKATKSKRTWYATDKFDEWYALSSKTRTAGVKELAHKNLLMVVKEPVGLDKARKTFGGQPPRIRHVYYLTAEAAEHAPKPAAKTPPPPKSTKPLRRLKGAITRPPKAGQRP